MAQQNFLFLIFVSFTIVVLLVLTQNDFGELYNELVNKYYSFNVIQSAERIECRHRDYGYGSTVCVCNEKHCDTLDPWVKTPSGIIQVFETSKNGDRLKTSRLRFMDHFPEDDHDAVHIKLNRNETFQKIIGFGGAFTDSTGYNILKLPSYLQQRLIMDYFGQDGIEYTIGRVPIGGSDFSTRGYTYDDNIDDFELQQFSLQHEDFTYKIPFIQMAKAVANQEIKLFCSLWSPPAWMKTNNDLRHGGFLKGPVGGKYYQVLAKYFVKFLKAYQQENISFWATTIVNEPFSGFDPNYGWNCLGLNASMERDFLKQNLGPELYRNGFTKDKLNVMIFDDQMPRIKSFTETLMADPEAAKYVSGVGFHWYHNHEAQRTHLDELYRKYSPSFYLLATEACEIWSGRKQKVYLGSWLEFNHYASDIIQDLIHYTSGWVDWNLALDLQGGPNWSDNYVDAPIIVNHTSGEYYKQPIFYAMAHFSKFLTPGSIRIGHCLESNNIQELLVTTFQRPDQAIVLIVLNQNDKSVNIKVEDGKQTFYFAIQPQSMVNFVWY